MEKGQLPAEWLPHHTYADYEAWEGDWELIYGIPYAMSPSPKRVHQSVGKRFMMLPQGALTQYSNVCDCEVYHGLEWIIDDSTVVRPDVMVICGEFEDDFLRFPSSLIVEITSKRTQSTDRNVKLKLYEKQGVPYYIIADTERNTTRVFQLVNQHYQVTQITSFLLKEDCTIDMDVNSPWLRIR